MKQNKFRTLLFSFTVGVILLLFCAGFFLVAADSAQMNRSTFQPAVWVSATQDGGLRLSLGKKQFLLPAQPLEQAKQLANRCAAFLPRGPRLAFKLGESACQLLLPHFAPAPPEA